MFYQINVIYILREKSTENEDADMKKFLEKPKM